MHSDNKKNRIVNFGNLHLRVEPNLRNNIKTWYIVVNEKNWYLGQISLLHVIS